MKTFPNQTNFSQGELSPLMGGRTELEIYAAGVGKMLNMYSDSRGPAITREGIKRVLERSGTNARVETLPRTASTFFTIILMDLELILIRDIFNPIIEILVAPWTKDQIDDVQVVPLPDGSDIYFLHPEVQPYKLTDNTAAGNSQEFLIDGTFNVPSAGVTDIAVCICGGGGGGSNSVSAPAPGKGGGGGGGGGVIKKIISVVPSEAIIVTIGAGGLISGGNGADSILNSPSQGITTAKGGKGGTLVSGVSTGGLGAEGGGNGGASQIDGENCSAVCGSESFSGGAAPIGSVKYGGGGGGGGYGNGGNGNDNGNGIAASNNTGGGGGAAGGGNFTGGEGGSGRCVITWEISTGNFILAPVVFVAPPANWTGANWPSAGTYYQGRLWLGGAPDQKETFLGSKSNDPENFTIGPLADDAMTYSIEKFGQIEWMESTKNLIIGTGNAEYIVTAEQGLIKPGDIEVDQQSEYGSASIQPAKIGDQVIYVSPDGRKIRAINYNRDNDNWLSKDLTFPSEHITEGIIKDLTWCQNPNNFLWGALKDGSLCCMTYERAYGIIGWHRHETVGEVLGSASGFDGKRSVLIIATERVPGTIEIGFLNFDYKLDSWKESSNIITLFSLYYADGFDHLEGKEVQVLGDGSVHPNRVVGTESSAGAADGVVGRIYLTTPFNKIVAGLQFIPELELLPVDGGSPAGSGISHVKRRNDVSVTLYKSGAPLVNGKRGGDRSPSTPMGTPEPLITGIRKYTGIGWDKSAVVNIKQDLPLPLTVMSVHGSIVKNKL